MKHTEPSPLAGKTVTIKKSATHSQVPHFGGSNYLVEDWHDRVLGQSWAYAQGNPAAIIYALRSGVQDPPLPDDDEVLYGKIGPFGHLVHVSEIEATEVSKP